MNRYTRSRRARGFTLPEVMFSAGIFVMLGAMVFTLVIGVNRSLIDSQNKSVIDRNFRSTTSSLSKIVSCADFIYVFDSQNDDAKALADKVVPQNLAGDYLVTVYYKNPGRIDPKTGQFDTTVSRIAGVCRFPDPANAGRGGPVYMFDSSTDNWGVTFPAAADSSVGSVTALLPSKARIVTCTKLADMAYASSATVGSPDTGVFINQGGTGALMLARIRVGTPGKYVSNGYSFSISSRNL